ncbi:hypothetical protein ACRE_085370 [Hapsidospora chrysogenum ATCC 11550]|uniref:DUF7514 domain-containing protein n=1 Tax=Hapsidospora chrysogenum (strain ATCC 11550 / CBS 779.69 / DSM 880 / IAM 14645 / JCM 23072 / IMI 49137) TaxID=857340 RepID=A0A086SUI1_HAPC1|nr:hypothetical protein ACRE_085370 [Hapsidospora chrysogenum ATCC 11550]
MALKLGGRRPQNKIVGSQDTPSGAPARCGRSRTRPDEEIPPEITPSKPYQATVEDCESSGGDDVLKGTKAPSPPKQPAPRVHFSSRPPPKICQSPQTSNGPMTHTQNTSKPRVRDDRVRGTEMSPVDVKWGRLFDDQWQPTERLRDVYRAIADYMIEFFDPKGSTVLISQKLFDLYTMFGSSAEIIPFSDIFSSRPEEIMALYNHMGCEYHLVPWKPGATPDRPALTANGFVQWMEYCIRVSPENEAERLSQIVEKLPIEAQGFDVGGQPGRLPKQLSRHLFPPKADQELRGSLAKAYDAGRRRYSASPVHRTPLPAVVQQAPRDHREIYAFGEPASDEIYTVEPASEALSAWRSRNSAVYDVSTKYVPRAMNTTSADAHYQPRHRLSSPRPCEEELVEHTRRHRSPSPHGRTRRRRRYSSPPSPPRRQSPPPRPHRNSTSSGGRYLDLFRGISSVQPRHAEHRRRSSDSRRHSPDRRRSPDERRRPQQVQEKRHQWNPPVRDEVVPRYSHEERQHHRRRQRHDSRELEEGRYRGSRGGELAPGSAESTPRSSPDSRYQTATPVGLDE